MRLPFRPGGWPKTRYNAGMNQIEAIYENGVFRPLGPVELRDNELVRLSVEPVARPEQPEGAARRREEGMQFTETQLRWLAAGRGLDWDRMSDDEREALVDELVHEDRKCGR